MFHKRLCRQWIVWIFIIVAFCTACSGKEKKDDDTLTYFFEEGEEDYLDVQSEASLHQVKLSWNQVEGISRYVIIREEHKTKGLDHNEIGKLIKKGTIAELSPEETSFRDNDVKAGNYYIYDIYAYRDTDVAADSWDDAEQKDSSGTVTDANGTAATDEEDGLPSVLNSQEIIWLNIGHANWDAAALHMDGFSAVTSPTDITLNAVFVSDSYDIEPMGMEIYRGASPLNMAKLADIPFTEDEFLEKDGAFRYTDETVEMGKTYYYQVTGYIDYEGQREYGTASSYLKRTAVLSVGEYSMDAAQSKNGFEISLQSSNEGNAKLEFIANQFNALVDYIYQKNDYSYGSMSMCLEAYRRGDGKWKSYQGQNLCLEGREKVTLRFVPIEGEKRKRASWSKDSQRSAEILLMTKYNGELVNMHLDLRKNRTFLTDLDSETGMEWAYWDTTEKTINADDIHKRVNKQNAKVPDVDISGGVFHRIYAGSLSFWPAYTEKNIANCPDGVEIYRSTDNINFSKIANVKYPLQDNVGYAEHVEYDDPTVMPGKNYYYKARNYIDTEDGRIYGKLSEKGEPYFTNYDFVRYKMWQAEGKVATGREPLVIGLYSCSLGNSPLKITLPGYGMIQKSNEQTIYGFTMTEYSTDAVHWKKITDKTKKLKLLPKKTLYLKIKPDDIDWEDAETFSLDAERPENTYVGWEGDGGGVELSCKINSTESLQQIEE